MTAKIEYRIIDIERLKGDFENMGMKMMVLEKRIRWLEEQLVKKERRWENDNI